MVAPLAPCSGRLEVWCAFSERREFLFFFFLIALQDLLETPSLNCTEIAHKKVHGELLHCSFGLISRSGVAVVDDSGSFCLQPDLSFWDSPSQAQKDIYVFAHGLDFKGALAEYSLVGGRAALPLRGVLGIMHSRWYNYDTRQVKQVGERSFLSELCFHFFFLLLGRPSLSRSLPPAGCIHF